MRSIRTTKSGAKEKEEYYTNDESLKKDEYYSEAEMESSEYKVTTAQWMGPKAASLGLTGDVEQAKFKQLFYGYLPGTSQRIRGDRKHGQENLAVDCTLSAPKSFSMHALIDLRLYEDHMEACRRTLAVLDQRYGFQRKFIEGKQVNVMGDGLIAAAIPHWTSREEDMMLHTHLVIFNGVQGPDGKWRAFDDRQFSYAEWAGSFYRNELAKLTQQRGYKIREVALKDGGHSFEIEGISRSEIEHFSKRSMQIAEAAEAKGVERNAVVLTTRKAKRISKTWQEFRDDLIQEMERRGVELQIPSNHPVENPIGRTDAAAEIDSAIRHLSERSVSFKREDLFKYALDHMQQFELSEIETAINSHPELIQTQDPKIFTTADALSREIRTIKTWEKGSGKAKPVLDEVAALNALKLLEGTGLNQGQAEAIVGVLSSTNRHLIIHGLAGVGKTTALKQLKQLIEENGSSLKIKGYSPTIKAAKHLGSEMGIETNTVEHLVQKTSKGAANELWIIDEAGMVSARQMEVLLNKADEIGARILLVGDTNQNHSIEAGSPMKSLMKYGVTDFNIHEIVRQKDEIQKRAVELASSGRGSEALSLLYEHGWVQEIEDYNARAQAAAQEWLSLSPEEREDTLIVTGTNAERLRITEKLRLGLREEGKLGEDHTFKQLVSRQLTTEEKSRAENYDKGDYIRLNWQYKTTPLQKDKLYQVVGKKQGQLLVETEGGRLYWFDPSKYKDKEVFYEQDIALAVGDRLRWRITNKPKGQINGMEFTVKSIDGKQLAVIDEKGQKQVIDGSKPLGLDYALVWTAHGSQGLSKKQVIVSATSGPTSAKEPFYVKISRQKKRIVVFADNLEDLHKWVRSSAAQDNPLELIGENYGNVNSRSESYGVSREPERARDSSAERTGDDFQSSTRADGQDRQLAGNNRESSQNFDDTERGQERYLSYGREGIEDGRAQRRDASQPTVLTGSNGSEARQADSLQHIADTLVRVRLQRELAEPMARLQELLEASAKLERSNQEKQASISAKLKQYLAQAKVEVLDTTLTEWRSLTQEPALALPELPEAIALSDVAQLTNLIERFPAQKVIKFAMEDFYQATNLIIDTKSTQKLGSPIFRGENTMPTKTVEPPKKRQSTAPGRSTAPPPNKRTRKPGRSIPKPIKPESPFWVPDYTDVICPDHIEPHHWQEMQDSGIHPDLINLNIQSISGIEVTARLLEDKFSKLDKNVKTKRQIWTKEMKLWLDRFEPLTRGGWWGKSGTDALSLEGLKSGQKAGISTTGVFKADEGNRRIDRSKTQRKGETTYIKYENPVDCDRPFFLANVPDWLAAKIYEKHWIEPTKDELRSGFWHIVQKHNLPIVLIEGHKKALASLSQGIITIGTPGATLYKATEKSTDNQKVKLPKRVLLPELIVFAGTGRVVTIAKDQDENASTNKMVAQAVIRSAEVLEENNFDVRITDWEASQGKGGDDVIVKSGPEVYMRAVSLANPWKDKADLYYASKYKDGVFYARKNLEENAPQKLVDTVVYQDAIARGDMLDGRRYLSQSEGFKLYGDDYLQEIEGMIAQTKNTQQVKNPTGVIQRKQEMEDELELG